MTIERQCSGCSLCCKLIGVEELQKKAGERCRHQRFNGCAVYRKRGFPASCAIWNCRWLANADTANLRRPDRSHYVIDILPDFITLTPHGGAERTNVEVVQIWVDPKFPDAWRDPPLLAYLERRGEEGIAALIRWSSCEAMTVFPPTMSNDGRWREFRHGEVAPERTAMERFQGIAQAKRVKVG